MSGVLRRLAANAAVAACSAVVAFTAAEAVARLSLRDKTVLFPRYHTAYRYGPYTIRGIRPRSTFRHTSADGSWTFVTNGRGLRSAADFEYAKAPGTFRVLCLGDSHTQGYEVRQDATFSAVLQRYLENQGRKAEVLNAGVSGFSTAEELVFLENEGFKYQPDVVILAFFANDYEDNLKAGLFGLDVGGRLTGAKTEHIPGVAIQDVIYRMPGVKWLGENSYLYSVLFNGVWDHFKRRLARDAAASGASVAQGSRPAASDSAEYAVPSGAPVPDAQVALASALIERMGRFCQARQTRLIVVDIPTWEGPYRAGSSFLPELVRRMDAAMIEHIDSTATLGVYRGAAETHVPHGHHHISEFTHTLLGVTIGQRIVPQ